MKKSYLLLCAFVFTVALLLNGCGTEGNTGGMNDGMNGEMNGEMNGDMNDDMDGAGQPTQEAGETNGRGLVKLPDNYKDGVIYTTVTRGNAFENLYASEETIRAVQNGEPIPDGAVLTLEIFRDDVLDDIFVMEKRSDWNDQPTEKQNGDWRFEAYKADQELNMERDLARCISCHATQERDDFTYSLNRMKSFQLEDFTAAAEGHVTPVLKDWEIAAIAEYLAGISNAEGNG